MYSSDLNAHLASYKRDTKLNGGLEIEAEGEHDHRAYPHILPAGRYKENILEPIRAAFWDYQEQHIDEKDLTVNGTMRKQRPALHRCFPHLNSSQALAFNLFFPFRLDEFSSSPILLDSLGIPGERAADIWFEDVPITEEGTNFDVAIRLGRKDPNEPAGAVARHVVVEVKLSEDKFGSCDDDPIHADKFLRHYKEALLETVIAPDVMAQNGTAGKTYYKNYQILRYMSYLTRPFIEQVIFVVPNSNKQLVEGVTFINTALAHSYKNRVRVVYLEDLIRAIQRRCASNTLLAKQFDLIARKYLP